VKDSENPQSQNEELEENQQQEQNPQEQEYEAGESVSDINTDDSSPTEEELERYYGDDYNDLYGDDDEIKSKRSNFLVDLFNKVENFKLDMFKKKVQDKKEESKKNKEKKRVLKESKTTLTDIQQQRRDVIKKAMYKVLLISFIIILVMGAIILATQDNEKLNRPVIDTRKLMNDTTSFGGIDQKDYFLEQNVLDDKINLVEKNAKEGREAIKKQMQEQTKSITEHIDKSIQTLEEHQKIALEENKKEILSTVDEKLNSTVESSKEKIAKLEEKVEKYKNAPRMQLKDGKIVFPNSKDNKGFAVQNPIIQSNTDSQGQKAAAKEEEEEEEVTIDMSNVVIQDMSFDTGMEPPKDKNESDNIEFDLTTSLVRVTLIDGIKAATLDIGLNQPSPVLMSIEGVKYAANDHVDTVLKGCLLRGVGIGNINTSRVEIFGTHLSCVIEAESGKLYKIEHDFPKNQVWIKGEDGSDGVAGDIVDSSGKVLSKSAAVGFLQGLSNYFSAQNLVTGGLGTVNNTNQSTVAQLGTSMQSGVGSAMSSSFELIIKQYEKILNGYYPFIDVKGGRKNLTAVFGGKVRLVATPYKEADFENH
jgi:hypothetical protein